MNAVFTDGMDKPAQKNCGIFLVAAILFLQFGCATTAPKYETYNITTGTSAPVQQISDKVSQKIFDIKIAELSAKIPYYLKGDTLGISLKDRAHHLFNQQVEYSNRFNKRSLLGGCTGFGLPTLLYAGIIGAERSKEGSGEMAGIGAAVTGAVLFPIYVLALPISIYYCSRWFAGPQVAPEHSQALSTMIAEYNQAVGIHPKPMMPRDSLNK